MLVGYLSARSRDFANKPKGVASPSVSQSLDTAVGLGSSDIVSNGTWSTV
jgi:hypothetical protein